MVKTCLNVSNPFNQIINVMLGQMNYVAGMALTDDVGLYNSSETEPLAPCLVQVMSPYLVITLLLCVHTDIKLGYCLLVNSNRMTTLCDASPDVTRGAKCSGMTVFDWVAGGQIRSQLKTRKQFKLRSTMFKMFLVRK